MPPPCRCRLSLPLYTRFAAATLDDSRHIIDAIRYDCAARCYARCLLRYAVMIDSCQRAIASASADATGH